VVASVSGNNVLVWDLYQPSSQTETLSNYKQITSISWKCSDDKILATASQDNNLILWDVKNCQQIKRVNQQVGSLSTNIVTWNQRNTNMFATALDRTVKLWDMRKFDSGCELMIKEIPGSTNLRQISFDPVFGSLLLTQDKYNVRLYRTEDMQNLDMHQQKAMVTSQWLPFRNY
jgi:WD40 repeat protein